jgi:hypothetical protein
MAPLMIMVLRLRATNSVNGWPGNAWKKGPIDFLHARWRDFCELKHHHVGNAAQGPGAPNAAVAAAAPGAPDAAAAPGAPNAAAVAGTVAAAAAPAPALGPAPTTTAPLRVPAAAGPSAVAMTATPPALNLPRVDTSASPSVSHCSSPISSSSQMSDADALELASELGSMSLRRQYFFIDGHVFHTRYARRMITPYYIIDPYLSALRPNSG